MSEIITFPLPTGPNFNIPDVGDENWGQNVTNFLVAIPSGVMPTSGTFSLTGDVSLGPTFGLVSQYFKTATINPASAGFLRLSKTDSIDWRNNANSANLSLGIDGSDRLVFSSGAAFSSLTLSSPLTVPNGGTGDSSFTAYSVICGGTTSSNPLQSVASIGSSGQFLQSQGPGLLPIWANAAGTGTVNSGTAGDLAYYATSTNAVSDASFLHFASNILTYNPGTGDSQFRITTPLGGNVAIVRLSGNGLMTQIASDQNGTFLLTDVDNSRDFLAYSRGGGGSVGFNTPITMASHKITGLANPTTSGDALSYGQTFDMGAHKITGLANGTTATDAATFGQIPTVPAVVAPTIQRFTSGSGTYTRPTSPTPLYIKVKLVGAGGGGSGSGGGSMGDGSAGSASTFGSALNAGGGLGGTAVTGILTGGGGGAGGTTSASFGTIIVSVPGGSGLASSLDSSQAAYPGSMGGGTPFGGGARSGVPNYTASGSGTAGGSGATNTGEGGQGGSTQQSSSSEKTGSGGGGGGYLEVLVTSPSSSYAYSVGGAGSGGTAGTGGGAGGTGGSGIVIVEEYYQ